jgi:PAS domain S-box-containing protein
VTFPDDALYERAAATYGLAFEAIPDAVVVVDSEGRILFVNQQTEVLLGYPRQELLGQLHEVLLPERFRAGHVGYRNAYLEAPRVRPMGVGLELFAQHKDGREVPVEISLSPSALEGEVVVVSTIRDVSERRALLGQLQAIQTVTDAALAYLGIEELLPELLGRVRDVLHVDTVSILLLDANGASLVARAALGLEEEVAQGVHVPVGQGFAGRVAAEQRPVSITDIDQADLVNPLLAARGLRSLLGVPLLVERQLLGVLHVGSLIRRSFTDQETDLLQRVADRAALALDRARLYGEAQEALRVRNEFLSAITHDLGNPVSAIRMESRSLQRLEGVRRRNRELFEGLTQIEATATRMWRQVEELLDLARLQLGRALELRWQAMDLAATVREMVAAQQATTDRHTFRLELETEELHGEWDQPRLERVLTNVLANAVKYSPEGGEVVVRLRREEDPQRPGGWAVVEVRDGGIGIPAADLPHIFERFHRAGNVGGRFAGTGIGLSSAQQIVRQHGGDLEVTSQEGRGTTVSIRLPGPGDDLS